LIRRAELWVISRDPMSRRKAQQWTAVLEVVDPDGTRTRHPFQRPRMGFGRRSGNFVALPLDEAASAEHCEFVEENGVLIVRDLRSANGTWVNEQRVSEARLRDGDEVRIGGTKVRVTVRGPEPRRLPGWLTPRNLWLASALLGVVLLVAVLALRQRAAARTDAALRERYAQAVKALVQDDPCAVLAGPLDQLRAIDREVGDRSVAIALDRGEVKIAPQDRQTDVELVTAYRQKLEVYAKATRLLAQREEAQREALEKLSRLGQRFASGKDRKVSFWAEGLLNERLARCDDLLQGVRGLIGETTRFVALVEAVAMRGEAPSAAQLAHFRFTRDLPGLVRACGEESKRTSAGALSALNALEE
jgi:hypothetical protein